jgi:hypothetical protein
MKNSNIIGLIFNTFYLNELLDHERLIRNKQLLKIVKTTENKHKHTSLLSITRYIESKGSRLINLWYNNANYKAPHKLDINISCVEKYDNETIILGDFFKLAIHFYDVKTHSIVRVLGHGANTKNNIRVSKTKRTSKTSLDGEKSAANDYSYGKIESVTVISKDTVVGFDSEGHNIIIWDVNKGRVVKVIHEQAAISIFNNRTGHICIQTKVTIRYYDINDYSSYEHELPKHVSFWIREIFYISYDYLLIQYSNKRYGRCVLFQLQESTFIKVNQILDSCITLPPLVISDDKFIYVSENEPHVLLVYNFEVKNESIPLYRDEYRYLQITSYELFNENTLIFCNSLNEIRMLDLHSRTCKKVLYSLSTCWKIISINDSVITIYTDQGKQITNNHIQIWKAREFNLYPVLCANDIVIDLITLNKYTSAVLTERGIEIWNILTKKRVKYITEYYNLTSITKINSHLFACSDYLTVKGQMLYIYDRSLNPICEMNKGYISYLLANIDYRRIAYIKEDSKLCIFDTKVLKETKLISIKGIVDAHISNLEVVTDDKLALFVEGTVYIIDWKQGLITVSIDVNDGVSDYYYRLMRLQSNELILFGDELAVLNCNTQKISTLDFAMDENSFEHFTTYNKYLLRMDGLASIFNHFEYELLKANCLLLMRLLSNDVKFI